MKWYYDVSEFKMSKSDIESVIFDNLWLFDNGVPTFGKWRQCK